MGKKHPYHGKSMSISFPDFPHIMGFVAFSRTVGNSWGNPCISHMITSVKFFLCQRSLFCNFVKKRLQQTCFLMSFTRYFRHLLYRSPPVDCFCSKKKYFANKIVNSLLKEEKHAGKKNPTQTEKRLKDYLHQVFISFYFSKVSLFLFPLPPMMHFKHVF